MEEDTGAALLHLLEINSLRTMHRGERPRPVDGAVVAVANKDVTVMRPAGVTCQGQPLHHRAGVALQDALVVEGSGVPLLSVAEDVFLGRGAS